MTKNIAKIAIIKPLHNLFDYEIPKDMKTIKPGSRVCVEFGKKHVFGIVIKIIVKNKPSDYKLKKIIDLVDEKPIIDEETLNLFLWASNYYHSPIGQVIGIGTPSFFRQGKKLPENSIKDSKYNENFQINTDDINLTKEQSDAIKAISKSINFYECFLLDGITGSGKTEVYRKIQNKIYKADLQTLIIVPEKNLIPELLKYFNTISFIKFINPLFHPHFSHIISNNSNNSGFSCMCSNIFTKSLFEFLIVLISFITLNK